MGRMNDGQYLGNAGRRKILRAGVGSIAASAAGGLFGTRVATAQPLGPKVPEVDRVAVRVVTDSQYVQKGVQSWMADWKRRNWKTSAGKPVANRDLWEALDRELVSHQVVWEWVRGHQGHPGNERADQLANRGVESITL